MLAGQPTMERSRAVTTGASASVITRKTTTPAGSAFEKKAGKVSSYFSEQSYTNARWIVEAIKAVDGQVEDREKLLAALRAVDIADAPRGPIKVDRWGNPVQNTYIRKVEKVGGKLQNTVIHTYTNVSQFWKYNPEEYLKAPLYTRDFPACKHC